MSYGRRTAVGKDREASDATKEEGGSGGKMYSWVLGRPHLTRRESLQCLSPASLCASWAAHSPQPAGA